MFLPGERGLLVVHLGIADPATPAAGTAVSAPAAALRPHPLPREPVLHAAAATNAAAATAVGKSDPGGI